MCSILEASASENIFIAVLLNGNGKIFFLWALCALCEIKVLCSVRD
jgi:hypothetical protein